jgi:hypothetical protein
LNWIFPDRSELTVTVSPTEGVPLILVLPVVVWPSLWRQCAWAVGLFLSIVSARYVALVQGPEGEPFSCLARVATDLVFLGGVVSVAALLLLALKAAGFIWLAWGGPG